MKPDQPEVTLLPEQVRCLGILARKHGYALAISNYNNSSTILVRGKNGLSYLLTPKGKIRRNPMNQE